MSAIDLLLQAHPANERLHQIAWNPLLRHTDLLRHLRADLTGAAADATWEPQGGLYDLGVRLHDGRLVLLELKVDSELSEWQVDRQLAGLPEGAILLYVLLGLTGITARPFIEGKLKAHTLAPSLSVVDESRLGSALESLAVRNDARAGDVQELARGYARMLAVLHARTTSFTTTPADTWQTSQFYGFYDRCRKTVGSMANATICYVSNAAGGFSCCHWAGTPAGPACSTYLQFEDQALCFKIWVGEPELRSSLRGAAFATLRRIAEGSSLSVQRPQRFGSGEHMTVGIVPDLPIADAAATSRVAEALETAHQLSQQLATELAAAPRE